MSVASTASAVGKGTQKAFKYATGSAGSVMSALKSQILPGIGLGVGLGVLSGEKAGTALKRELKETALLAVAPGAYWTAQVAALAGAIIPSYIKGGKMIEEKFNENRRQMSQPNFQYMDTQQAMTMRQAAVQAIQGSKLNARNALGGEASLMHRSSRNGRYD